MRNFKITSNNKEREHVSPGASFAAGLGGTGLATYTLMGNKKIKNEIERANKTLERYAKAYEPIKVGKKVNKKQLKLERELEKSVSGNIRKYKGMEELAKRGSGGEKENAQRMKEKIKKKITKAEWDDFAKKEAAVKNFDPKKYSNDLIKQAENKVKTFKDLSSKKIRGMGLKKGAIAAGTGLAAGGLAYLAAKRNNNKITSSDKQERRAIRNSALYGGLAGGVTGGLTYMTSKKPSKWAAQKIGDKALEEISKGLGGNNLLNETKSIVKKDKIRKSLKLGVPVGLAAGGLSYLAHKKAQKDRKIKKNQITAGLWTGAAKEVEFTMKPLPGARITQYDIEDAIQKTPDVREVVNVTRDMTGNVHVKLIVAKDGDAMKIMKKVAAIVGGTLVTVGTGAAASMAFKFLTRR